MKEMIAVSACLLGLDTKYDGNNNYMDIIRDYIKDKIVLPICPEVFGGMTTPRKPSEQLNNKVLSVDLEDVSEYFNNGALRTIEFLKRHECNTVILKDGSPSCGTTYIYDGTFSRTRIPGMGVTAKILKDNGFKVIMIE